MDLTAIVPTRRNHIQLYRCLKSMKLYAPYPLRLIVINNDPQDPNVERAIAEAGWDDAVVVEGVEDWFKVDPLMTEVIQEKVETPFVALMNDDVLFIPVIHQFWEKLIRVVAHSSVGAVGPASNQAVWYQRAAHFSEYSYVKTHLLHGMCMVLKTETFLSAGGYSLPDGSDIDLCLSLWDQGMDLVVVRAAYLHHEGSQTAKTLPEYARSDWVEEAVQNNLIQKHGLKKYIQWSDLMISGEQDGKWWGLEPEPWFPWGSAA